MSKLFNLIGIIILIGLGISALYTPVQNKILNTPDGYRSFTSRATQVRFIIPQDYSREWNQSCSTKSICDSQYFTYKSYEENLQETRKFSYRQHEAPYILDFSAGPDFTNQYNIQWYSKVIDEIILLDRYSLCAYRESDATTHCFEGFDYDLIRNIAEHTQFTKN
jgi:hypothetical protein